MIEKFFFMSCVTSIARTRAHNIKGTNEVKKGKWHFHWSCECRRAGAELQESRCCLKLARTGISRRREVLVTVGLSVFAAANQEWLVAQWSNGGVSASEVHVFEMHHPGCVLYRR